MIEVRDMAEHEEPRSLPADVLLEVLKHVDGITLAKASCGSSVLRDCAAQEALWEHCCNARWPSTRGAEAKRIIAAAGGFGKVYSACYPLIVAAKSSSEAQLLVDVDESHSEDGGDEQSFCCSQSLVSFIDVVFAGRSVLAKTVLGVGGAAGDDGGGDRWFSTCPFRIDLLQQAELQLRVPIDETSSSSNGGLHDKLWRSLWENLRLSWILLDATTHGMTNLSSWEPVQGQRQWPTDDDFVIGFGSILPRKPSSSVQCSIVLKCRLLRRGDQGRDGWAILRLTELSIKLEDMAGSRLNGRDSLPVLRAALDCERSSDHGRSLGCYRDYVKAQSELKEVQMRHEKMLDTLALVSAIVALISLTFII